ncbi:hypothetical protein ACQP3D_31140, partial [Escherichia coli]
QQGNEQNIVCLKKKEGSWVKVKALLQFEVSKHAFQTKAKQTQLPVKYPSVLGMNMLAVFQNTLCLHKCFPGLSPPS